MDELLSKLLNKEKFTVKELKDLFEEYDEYLVDEWEDVNKSGRWYDRKCKVLELDGRYFLLNTDYYSAEEADNNYDYHPIEVYKAEVKLIEKVTWKQTEEM